MTDPAGANRPLELDSLRWRLKLLHELGSIGTGLARRAELAPIPSLRSEEAGVFRHTTNRAA